jgi:PilZ domain
MNEHRRSPRWQVNQQGKLKLEQAVEEVFCQVKDINYKGMKVVLEAKLPQDTAFRLNLRLSGNCTFEAEVWVAWVKVIDGINHYGLYFSRLKDADKDKIYRFVYRHLPKELVNNWWSEGSRLVENKDSIDKSGSRDSEDMVSEGIDDHRIFERFPVNLSARYLNLDTGKEGLANTQDVSAKGLGLATSEELRLHTALEIWLEMKNKGEPLYTRGEVVWVKKVDANNYKLGVELEKADLMGISRVFRS